MVRVWDPLVRFTHWLVAVAFFIAYFTEDDALTLHVWAGYTVGALVSLRLIWGFVGTRHARFSDFLFGPWKVIAYLGDLVAFRAKRYLGHSPAGGAMAIALWLGLLAVVWSGLEFYAEEEGAGPLVGVATEQVVGAAQPSGLYVLASEAEEEGDGHERGRGGGSGWGDIHETLANLLFVLVVLHLAGVVLASVAHRENLARSMVTGSKREG